jgi:hypothetical protein
MHGQKRAGLFTLALLALSACGPAAQPVETDGGAHDAGIQSGGSRRSCATNGDCTTSEVCYRTRCVPPRAEGDRCENGGQCERTPRTLFCAEGRCSLCADPCTRPLVCDRESGNCKRP